MINYIAVTGEPEQVKRVYRMAKDSLSSVLTFVPKAWFTKISANASWAVLVCGDDEEDLSQRVACSSRGFFVVNGPVLRFADRLDVATAALESAVGLEPENLFDSLSGSYNCASLTQKNGLIAFPDFSGTYPVYSRKMHGAVLVSNRASALAAIEPTRSPNLMALSWLIGHANIFGNGTPFSDVNSITPGTYLKTKIGGAQPNIYFFNNQVWPNEGNVRPIVDDLAPDEWSEIADDLVKNVSAAAGKHNGPLRLSLTGGKDSRLSLALAVGAGLMDRIETFTSGPPGSPEIDCAANVAAVAGVKHQAFVARPSQVQQDFELTWQKLRQHTFRFDGYVCPWDGAGAGVLRGRSLELTGFGGELYRGPGGHAKQFKNLSFIEDKRLIDRWINYHQKMDPLEILRADYRNAQVAWISEWLDMNASRVRVDTLPEKFYVENRLSNWNGPLAQNVTGKVKLMPLLSPKVARRVFQLHPKSRNLELFHFSVMAKLAPKLVELPFLNATWDPSLQGRWGLKPCPEPWNGVAKAQPRAIQAWQFLFIENQRNRIVELLREAKLATDIDQILDTEKLCLLIKDRPVFQVVEAKAILSAISIAHTLLDRGERVADIP